MEDLIDLWQKARAMCGCNLCDPPVGVIKMDRPCQVEQAFRALRDTPFQITRLWWNTGEPCVSSEHNTVPCMHDSCPTCRGTGQRADGLGGACVHLIACPCPKCTSSYCAPTS